MFCNYFLGKETELALGWGIIEFSLTATKKEPISSSSYWADVSHLWIPLNQIKAMSAQGKTASHCTLLDLWEFKEKLLSCPWMRAHTSSLELRQADESFAARQNNWSRTSASAVYIIELHIVSVRRASSVIIWGNPTASFTVRVSGLGVQAADIFNWDETDCSRSARLTAWSYCIWVFYLSTNVSFFFRRDNWKS